MSRPLILGSASPRRQAFLRSLGLEHAVIVADIDETPMDDEEPVALALRLAAQKAAAVAAQAQRFPPETLIITADTVVAQDGLLLGKPATPAEATAMLATLRAAPHVVVSGVCVRELGSGHTRAAANVTRVVMRAYTDAEIATYVATGDPMDKAGGYAIQHDTFAPVAALDGCFAGVMGLPLGDLADLLLPFGVAITVPIAPLCREHGATRCCREV